LTCQELKPFLSYKIYKVKTGSFGRSFASWNFEDCYVASNGETHYHARSIKQAVKGLDRKILGISKKLDNANQKINLDSKITRSKYQALTGACSEGIRQFLKENDLDNKKTITLRELLPILEDKKAFGLNKLQELLAQ
jgi:hypothetical protein